MNSLSECPSSMASSDEDSDDDSESSDGNMTYVSHIYCNLYE